MPDSTRPAHETAVDPSVSAIAPPISSTSTPMSTSTTASTSTSTAESSTTASATDDSPPIWVFGYGSIIWRPDFPCSARAVGWVDEHTRRFWQGSPDHRGTPSSLGRVVTLVPATGEKCWGVAYKLPPGREAEVLAYLDHRERGGYVRIDVEFTLAPLETLQAMGVKGFEDDNAAAVKVYGKTVRAITYIASPSNEHYLGPAPLDAMVRQIAYAKGESGRNAEYVLNLAAHLADMGLEDEHIQALAAGVKDMVDQGMCCSPVIGLKPLALV